MARISLELKSFSNLPSAAVSSSETTDCSYEDLINHLNLTSNNDLAIRRPVKHWANPTPVIVDTLLYGIVEVVSVCEHLCVNLKADCCSQTS